MHIINVLLVDDHELVRTGIAALLNATEGICVQAVANCGEQAVLLTEQLSPDIILMDVKMPGIGGREACRRILQAQPKVKIIALSADNDGFIPEELLKLGTMGFVSKNTPIDEMVCGIHKVMAGETYISSDTLNKLAATDAENSASNPFVLLSKREAEVVRLILQGHSIQEMAETLGLSDKTINTYRYRLYEKLGVKNDVELTRLAIKFSWTGY